MKENGCQPEKTPVYNPLAKSNLGASVAKALLDNPVSKLPPDAGFMGAGIYAIYYTGDYPLYKSISDKNKSDKFCQPIYVGKAVPAGARKGGFGLDLPAGNVLYRRLCEHAESIQQAKTSIELSDFWCRYVVVDDIWIPLGESLLIEMFSPVWNRVLDGFGNHDPGSGRHNQQNSPWDVLHPGRPWAIKLKPNARSSEDIKRVVEEFLGGKKQVKRKC
ncbi:MAG: restriction endonuclease [Planctomycetes bacterium GWF2_50_10]|nr:MAG: restriction endonuclease [Planctomycetes bacterium GWF2_50_10]